MIAKNFIIGYFNTGGIDYIPKSRFVKTGFEFGTGGKKRIVTLSAVVNTFSVVITVTHKNILIVNIGDERKK